MKVPTPEDIARDVLDRFINQRVTVNVFCAPSILTRGAVQKRRVHIFEDSFKCCVVFSFLSTYDVSNLAIRTVSSIG